jgi:fructose-1,6-bisphosphatase/inositol monophosphatase family enzyme
VGMLRVMSRRGDDRLTWDEQKVLEGNPEAIAAVREAERIFAKALGEGATVFVTKAGKPAQRVNKFDATAEQIIVPRVVGG